MMIKSLLVVTTSTLFFFPLTTTSFVRPGYEKRLKTSLLSVERRLALEQIQNSLLVTTSLLTIPTTTTAATPLPNHSPHPLRLWLDADPSGFVWTGLDCDDDLAILVALALQQNHLLELEGISVCGGNAPLRHTRQDMNVLLKYVNYQPPSSYQVGYGWRDMQISRKWLKWMNRIQPDVTSSQQATQAILNAAAAHSEAPPKLTVLTLGPPTNLAKALQQNPSLASRLEHVYMMGGELTHQRLDLNFASDRAAARTVVNANVPTTLIPIQLCAQVILDGDFVDEFQQEYCGTAAACALLPKLRQQVQTMPDLVNPAVKKRLPPDQRWSPSPNLDRGFIPWDIVAVLSITHPHLLDEWEYHRALFPTCGEEGEPCDRTMVVNDLPRDQWPSAAGNSTLYDHSGIVRIPHKVKSETEIKQLVKELLGNVSANPNMRPPGIMLGFLGPVGGLAAGTLGTLGALLSSRLTT
jgi:inosine-uridine nucleoside N-ribohydrolase